MRHAEAADNIEVNEPQPVKRFQFSLGTMLAAVLYAGLLATLIVNFAGKEWTNVQTTAAYFVTIALVVGFAALSKARGKISAYLMLAPVIFVAAVTVGALLHEPYVKQKISPGTQPPRQMTPIGVPPGL